MNGGYGMSFYDYMHEREYEDEQHRARAVEMLREPLGPTASDFQDAAAQVAQEREQQCEWALREALCKGTSISNIEILCAAVGISYDRVVGNTEVAAQYAIDHTPDQDEDTMKLDDMIESKYLKQSDVDTDTLVTVAGLKKVNVARDDEDPEYRWTIKFEEFPKPMVLNKTNLKRAFAALGEDTEEWLGKKIVVYVDPDIEFGGNIVGGLRLRAKKQPGKPPAQAQGIDKDDIPF